jgi:hypothetical protein
MSKGTSGSRPGKRAIFQTALLHGSCRDGDGDEENLARYDIDHAAIATLLEGMQQSDDLDGNKRRQRYYAARRVIFHAKDDLSRAMLSQDYVRYALKNNDLHEARRICRQHYFVTLGALFWAMADIATVSRNKWDFLNLRNTAALMTGNEAEAPGERYECLKAVAKLTRTIEDELRAAQELQRLVAARRSSGETAGAQVATA